MAGLNTVFRFLDLPGEIRNRIYDVLLCSFDDLQLDSPEMIYHRAKHGLLAPQITDITQASHSVETAILRTSKQVHREAYDVMVKTNRFVHVESRGLPLSQIILMDYQVPVVTMDRAHADQFQGYLLYLSMTASHGSLSGGYGPFFNFMLLGRDWDRFCEALADRPEFTDGANAMLWMNRFPLTLPSWKDSIMPYFSEKIQKELLSPVRKHLRDFSSFGIVGTVDRKLADTVRKEIGRQEWTDPQAFIDHVQLLKDRGNQHHSRGERQDALREWGHAISVIDRVQNSRSWDQLKTKGRVKFADDIIKLQFLCFLNSAHIHVSIMQQGNGPEDITVLSRGEMATKDLKRCKEIAEDHVMRNGGTWQPSNAQIAKCFYRQAMVYRMMKVDGMSHLGLDFINMAFQYAPEESAVFQKEKDKILEWRNEEEARGVSDSDPLPGLHEALGDLDEDELETQMEEKRTTSQPRLTWDNPNMRSLHKRYWAKHHRDFSQASFSHMQEWSSNSNDPFVRYCIANGYLHTPPLNEDELLDNEIHPILARENWLIESDISIDWFVHLRYGELCHDDVGRLYIEASHTQHTELPRLRAIVRKDLRALAGKIRFTWLSNRTPGLDWLTGTAGLTQLSVKYMIDIYEADLDESPDQTFWLCGEAIEEVGTPTICLPIDMYYATLASQGNPMLYQSTLFRRYLGQAIILVHEIAHAVGILWGQSSADGIEVLHSHSDAFPELGLSWERHVFGGKLGCELTGPSMAMTIEDSYPSDGQMTSTPMVTFLKMDYVNQFFLKKTWEHLDQVREKLYAPTIDRSDEFFRFGRFLDGGFTYVVYINEDTVPDEYMYHRLQERENVVITWEQNAARKYHLAEVVRYYRKIWKLEQADAWASGTYPAWLAEPHFYHYLTGAWASFTSPVLAAKGLPGMQPRHHVVTLRSMKGSHLDQP
ncbi:hypothetical protein BDV96DRAFT_594413 [Lophiotrema nucula]|uniref:Uncharacterized protein n=1 Tax=Lophiotrema nucula TaxID=690887 RepID=A0A6A5ZSD0_9PLEO|nr:hypothetical protein BDV96DRAFT_594413 [Lophiotrema nucula]